MFTKAFVKNEEYKVINFVLMPQNYGMDVKSLNEMFKAVQIDFENVKDKDCKVVQQAGNRYARLYALEWSLPIDTKIPSDYVEWQSLNHTY